MLTGAAQIRRLGMPAMPVESLAALPRARGAGVLTGAVQIRRLGMPAMPVEALAALARARAAGGC